MSGGGHNNHYNNKWKYVKRKKKSTDENNSEHEENPAKKRKNVHNREKAEALDPQEIQNRDGLEAKNSDNDDQEPKQFKKKRQRDNPYIGWDFYFHDEEYQKNSETVKKIQIMERFMQENQELISQAHLTVGGPFNLDLKKIHESQIFFEDWSDFNEDLNHNPSHTLNCVGLAVHQTVVNTLRVNKSDKDVPMIRVRVLNFLPVVPLKDLRMNYYGHLVTTRGCVMRVGRSTQLAQWHVFSCIKCKLKTVYKQPGGNYTVPKKCGSCGAMKFEPVLDSPYVKTVSAQTIRLQQHLGDNQDDKGGTLRVIDVELIDDLVDTCMPGADVVVTGLIKGPESDSGKSKKEADPRFQLHIEAVSITSNKTNSRTKGMMMIDLNYTDYVAVNEIHANPNIFALLVHSLCPNIYGLELIKAGLLLSLFGGNALCSETREDIHVLIVGDPGLGKSQMLLACSRLAPRGVYICGNSSTSAGLTVTLLKEPGTNDYILEPGALVLADRGVCVIDEFDKMTNQHQALLEAMEQQCVSVAKSGVIWSLSARTSILAAANPIGGHYNKCKSIRENLNLSQPLLSRFDLVFLLVDDPNKDRDAQIMQHVMAIHRNGGNRNDSRNKSINSSRKTIKAFDTLKETLADYMKENPKVIPHSVFRKYIAYARQYVRPRLSAAATKVLQNFYLELRQKQTNGGNIPIFHRQLEALIRLTEIVAFINLLKRERMSEKQLFTKGELEEIAEDGGISIDDMTSFIDQLNEKGFLLKKGSNLYKFLPS
ncbi:DNA helicase MCM8-like isoform X2 [Belonocnema kinseyi]|uniref:DNA helicase MCM8-like isoform X2 n=1 Tax=Belonocnema kinseyi TaxID=2817044 RepID=UPI00143DD9E6|nr:DNA helicase MCM8-like isoform X2 [Belonocnema kinseyi]